MVVLPRQFSMVVDGYEICSGFFGEIEVLSHNVSQVCISCNFHRYIRYDSQSDVL